MGRVTVHFSEDDYQLFHHYCANYCRLYDETRKNSIKILLELYKHQVIDFQENSLDSVYAFFYQKKQDFETAYRVPASGANEMMRMRVCSDIIAFLGDLEKIFILVGRKGLKANYLLIIGTFSKIIDDENQMRLEDLRQAASGAISSIVLPLGDAIEKKLGPDVDTRTLLKELVTFAGTFNRLSPDLKFNDEIIDLVACSLIRRFNREENYDELKTLLNDHRNQFEIDEFESALDGGLHAQNEWGLEFSWEGLLIPLRELYDMIEKSQNLMLVPLDVLSALEAPITVRHPQSEYTRLALYQNPYGMLRRRNDENRFLVKVDNYAHSEVHLSSPADLISPALSKEDTYKQYFSLTAGVAIILIILLASILFSLYSAPVNLAGNTTDGLNVTKTGTIAQSGPVQKNPTVKITPIPPLPTPSPTPQYVTVEPVLREPDTGPVSHGEAFDKLALVPDFLFNPKDYITIFKNNQSYNLEKSFKISFDLKNPPMVIRYKVVPYNITDIKWFEPRDTKHLIDTAIVVRPDEFAWFELKIYAHGTLFDQTGWGRLYGIPLTTQEFVIRNPDMYQIEFSGRQVTVSSEVLVKKEGNILV